MTLNPMTYFDRALRAAMEMPLVLYGVFLSLLAVLPQEFAGTEPDKFLAL